MRRAKGAKDCCTDDNWHQRLLNNDDEESVNIGGIINYVYVNHTDCKSVVNGNAMFGTQRKNQLGGVQGILSSFDMKLDAMIVEIVKIGDFIFMFLGLDLVLYIWGYLFIVYVTLIRFIVLYSWCRVNRGTNLSVVLYYVIFLFVSTAHLGFRVGAFPTCGVHPHYAVVHSASSLL